MQQYLDQGMERWIYSTAHRNYWRVPPWYELADLIQDGFMCYAKCVEAYGRLRRKRKPHKDDRRNFMALVRTTYLRHITDLANWRTRTLEKTVSAVRHVAETAEAWLERHAPLEHAMQDLSILVAGAPNDIKRLIQAVTGDASDAVRYLKRPLNKPGLYVRETTNEMLCRLAGNDPKKVDMVERLRHYFAPQPA